MPIRTGRPAPTAPKMAALALLAAAAAAPTASGGCAYTPHPGTTYLGPDNVIACKNAEGLAGCRARCTTDAHCASSGQAAL